MKFKRHNTILRLITENDIETQQQLAEMLVAEGFPATQATVSRDIKELNIIKVHDHDEHYKYAVAKTENQNSDSSKLHTIFRESVVSIDYAVNTVVIRTLIGTASAAAAAIDSMHLPNIVGTLAGDDTIFVVMRSQVKAQDFCTDMRNFLK
ncbi:MAG: arginine repressor [Clostridia bacterium]|nr:arginine repressor [Clostridia bacterium]MBR5743444.1 arginine repressor [Clostridia bacterium]